MPLFVCKNCGAIENSALGRWWGRYCSDFEDEKFNKKALCSACVPHKYSNGEDTGYKGEGHGRFPKEIYDPSRDEPSDFMNPEGAKKIAEKLYGKN